jgi:hypothetical protein
MINRLLSLLFICFSLIGQTLYGQTGLPPQRTCGTEPPPAEYEEWFSQKVAEYVAQQQLSRAAVVNYTLPVIIHIIHSGTAEGSGANISTAQAQSQIPILNADFAGTNSDIGSVPSVFNSVKSGNTGIQFCLAKVDPSGNLLAQEGIERINRVSRGWQNPGNMSSGTLQSYFDQTIKPATIWDPTKYLNVWITDASTSGLLGYASFPAGTGLTGLSGVETATTCGVVVNYEAWGNIGSAAAPYNKGRTATHEIGHWLGLRHIWGDGTCATDYCGDTPPAQTSNYGCPTHPFNSGACSGNSSGEMFMNYMDYTNDACMYMFTLAQATRMQTAMANGTYRIGLNSSGKCNSPYTLDIGVTAILNPVSGSTSCNTAVTPSITLSNLGSSTVTSATITYSYDGGTASTFAWTGSLASGASTTVALPTNSTLSIAAHTFTASSSLPNGSADQNAANNASTSSFTIATPTLTALPFSQGFQGTTFVPTGWTLSNTNGDGTWTRTTTAGGFGTSTASARMDSYSPNTSNAGTIDEMITPTFGLVGYSSATLSFDVAYARYNATNIDSLIVLASTDCGVTWTRLYNKGGSGLATAPDKTNAIFVPTSSQWRTETINLASYVGASNIRFAFRSRSGYGQALYIDNINLTAVTASVQAGVSITQTTGSNPICSGSTATFTASATNGGSSPSFQWLVNGTNAGTGPTFTTTSLTNGSVVSCVLTSNLAGVTGNPATSNAIPMTVNQTPATPTPNSNGLICSGNTLNLSTTTVSGATYAWSGPNSYASTSQNPTRSNANTGMSGSYSLVVTAAGCSSSAGTVTVAVNQTPSTPNPSSNSPVCSGNALNLSVGAVSNASYAWSGPSGFTSTSQNPSLTNATTSMSGAYSLTTTVNGCSSGAGTVNVTINSSPAIPTPSSNSPICSGSSLNLATTTVANASYAWTGPNGYTSTQQNPTRTNSTTTMSGTYSLIITVNGCSSAAGSVAVTVNSAAITPNAASNSPVCAGNALNLSTSVTGASYTWTGPNGFSSTLQNPNISNATTAEAGTYTLIVTSGNCTSAPASISVAVNNALATPNIVTAASVCVGGSISLSTSAVSNASYAWSGPNGFTSIQQNPTINNISTNNAGTYTLTLTANGCTSSQGTAVVVVLPIVTPNISINSNPSNAVICAGDNLAFTSTSANGGSSPTYTWLVNNVVQSGSTQATFASSNLSNGDLVKCQLFSSTACATPSTVSSNAISVVVDSTATPIITASGADLVSSQATSYQWYLNGSILPGATAQTYTPTAIGDYTVVTTNANCPSNPSLPYTVITVGIDKVEKAFQFAVFPNPTEGEFRVELEVMTGQEGVFELRDMLGQLVWSKTIKLVSGKNSLPLSIQQEANGIYTLAVMGDKLNQWVKLVVEK